MSYLGTRTKKVATYGKKTSRIINIHPDSSPERPSTPPTPQAAASPLSRRVPLQAKQSQDVLRPVLGLKNADSKPPAKQQLQKPTQAKAIQRMAPRMDSPVDEPSVRARPVSRARKVVLPRSPSGAPVRSRCEVVIPMRKPPQPLRDVGARVRATSTDLAEQLSHVHIRAEEPPSKPAATSRQPDQVAGLLSCCTVQKPLAFEDIFKSSSFKALLSNCSEDPIVRKFGEASYSEVYTVASQTGGDEVVVKIIPLVGKGNVKRGFDDVPDCSDAVDVQREIEITRRMAGVPGGGFVNFLGSFVVTGEYPDALLEEWDRYKKELGSQNIRPDGFSARQQYALIVLPNGGADLESFKFDLSRGWVQAAAVFWQVADALARAESWTEFEHRDLHEGQILVEPVESDQLSPVSNYLDPCETAVRTTIIDFGLSRLDMPSKGPTSVPFPDEVYEGVGAQWDVYRSIRARVLPDDGDSNTWAAFHPITNALWLQYIARRLLHSTSTLRKPQEPKTTESRLRSGSTGNAKAPAHKTIGRKRAFSAWTMMLEIETVFATALTQPRRATRGQAAAARMDRVEITSARDVVAWGRRRGWIL